jgi:hypothetical protein
MITSSADVEYTHFLIALYRYLRSPYDTFSPESDRIVTQKNIDDSLYDLLITDGKTKVTILDVTN